MSDNTTPKKKKDYTGVIVYAVLLVICGCAGWFGADFINANLGGTSILTWLSREAIDGNAAVYNDIVSLDRYIPLSDWKKDDVNFGGDMTCNFNDKIAPLSNFRLSGMI